MKDFVSINSFSQKRIGFLVLVGLMCLILGWSYSGMLNGSTSHVLKPNGDAFNAYHIVTYQAKYGGSFTHFKGNAYPYGDHIVLASALPLLSNSLLALKQIGLDFTDYTIPIIHYSILFSYLVGAIFLYLFLLKFNLPAWYCVLVAIGISLLSPQTDRIFDHFGLAHAYAIPMTIYFLFIFYKKPNWRNSFFLFLTVVFTSLIQFYFFVLTAFLIAGFYGFLFIKNASPVGNVTQQWQVPKTKIKQFLPHFFFQVVLPYVLFSWWIAQILVTDRPPKPFGFTEYVSQWEGIFLSLRMPYFQWINEQIIPFRKVAFEGIGYVGLVATIVFVIMVLGWIRYFFKRSFFKNLNLVASTTTFLQCLFATAITLLIFSSGFPFTIPRLEFLLEYAGPLKQFRSVGRFNWVFYYVLNLIAFIFIYKKLNQKKGAFLSKINTSKILIISPILVLFYEARQFNNSHTYQLYPLKELQEKAYFKKHFRLQPSKYQAVLSLPFFHVGTDNFIAKVPPFIQQKSSLLTMETGLPTIAAMSNRSSMSNTYKLLQAAAEPYRIPAFLKDLPNNKPILVIVDSAEVKRYDYILPFLKFLGTNDRVSLYEMPLNFYQNRLRANKLHLETQLRSNTLSPIGNFLSSDSIKNFIYENFDTKPSENPYQGTGGMHLNISQEQLIYKGRLPNAIAGEEYVLSLWCDVGQFPAATSFVFIKAYEEKTGKLLWHHFPQIRNFLSLMDNDGWALFEFKFILPQGGIIEVSLEQKDMIKQKIFVDELLFKPAKTMLYKSDNQLFINNRWFPK